MAHQFKRKAVSKDFDSVGDQQSFVKLGTPLPPLSSSKPDQNVFVPIWKQEVTDDQGRRRLHGAFTGGFSAGYFNTVGSKEGWNPATFKSSRADKKAQEKGFISQRPEDFMDEEDLAELAQSKELQTNSVFGSSSSIKSSHLTKDVYNPLTGILENTDSQLDSLGQLSRPSAVDLAFSEFAQPSDSRAGYKIMKKMGWRDGQGIGPRITHERRLLLASKLGIDLNAEIDLEEDPERKKHLFAPIDRPMKPVQPWPGLAGLGHSYSTFSPVKDPLPVSFSQPNNPETKDERIKIPQGSSFGLGALNDTEDDDQDIYGSASDQVTSDPRARRLLNLSEENTNASRSPARPFPKAPDRHTDQGAKVFQDNTNLPKGFHLSVAPNTNLPSSSYLPPKVPETWKPFPKRIWEAAAGPSQASGPRPSSQHPNRPINAHDRARLIAEQAPPRSVFDFISAKDKARLEDAKQIAQASSHMRNSNQESDHGTRSAHETPIIIPKLDPVIAKSALSGFIPFSHDPLKQERYKLYLQSQAGILPSGTQFAPKPTSELTAEVINKELEGFAKSAMMFKPMSAMMASRFTSAASSSAGGELAAPEPGLRQPVFLDDKPEDNAPLDNKGEEEPFKELLSQADQAVRIDMFGMLTRTVKTFYPQKLLCKRFNVPNPFPDGPLADPTPKSASNNLTGFLASHGFQPVSSGSGTGDINENTTEQDNPWLQKKHDDDSPPKSINQVGLGGDETQGREILTASRPPLDLFKAIFADDTEDEGSTNGEDNAASNHLDEFIPQSAINSVAEKLDSNTTLDITNPTQQVISLTPVVVDPKAIENLASFRPTFLKKTQLKEDDATHTSSKKGTKKKKRAVLISFDDDQVDESVDQKIESKKKKKKKLTQDESAKAGDSTRNLDSHIHRTQGNMSRSLIQQEKCEEEDEWVETVIPIPHTTIPLQNPKQNESTTSKTVKKIVRMKASDLMD